ITAKARCGVWMMAKALHLCLTVTDGGIGEADTAAFHERMHGSQGRKPGLDTLARMAGSWTENRRDRGRSFGPLALPEGWRENPRLLDKPLQEHVEAFWAPYKLPFQYTINCERTFAAAAWWNKADVAMDEVIDRDGSRCGRIYKMRGKDYPKRKVS